MVVLDNLVVTTALPVDPRRTSARRSQSLEWTVNAYTLSFAVLLLTGAALGDRFGRRRMFVIGLALFTVASARGRARAHDRRADRRPRRAGRRRRDRHPADADAARRARSRPSKRGLAIGAWSGISGLGVALGPLVGGAVVEGISWHWIFWLNVPIGLALLAARARAG